MNEKNCKHEFENCMSLPIWSGREPNNWVRVNIRHRIPGHPPQKWSETSRRHNGEDSVPINNEILPRMRLASPQSAMSIAAAKRRKNAAHGASRGWRRPEK